MLSAGMLFALASATAARSLGLPSGLPPLIRAATVISLIRRVKMRPRLASSAPFLCLIVLHFECPDMRSAPEGIFILAHVQQASIAARQKKAPLAGGWENQSPGDVLLFHAVASA